MNNDVCQLASCITRCGLNAGLAPEVVFRFKARWTIVKNGCSGASLSKKWTDSDSSARCWRGSEEPRHGVRHFMSVISYTTDFDGRVLVNIYTAQCHSDRSYNWPQ